jgi:hypothetical protein
MTGFSGRCKCSRLSVEKTPNDIANGEIQTGC